MHKAEGITAVDARGSEVAKMGMVVGVEEKLTSCSVRI
jgi:hypothetical protein